jgi:hypothetical protein
VAVYNNDAQSAKVCKSVLCGSCVPANDLSVKYSDDCKYATLTWVSTSSLPVTYNIYRDEVLIKEKHTSTSYPDFGINPKAAHTWEVKVVCPTGNLTEGATADLPACDTEGINENAKTIFSIVPNPAHNNITIAAGTNFHTIEIISFIGQTVLSQPQTGNSATLDISNFTNGVYFVRIISDYGTSVKKFVKQ